MNLSLFDKYFEDVPLVLVDVGARDGIKKIWRKAVPYLKVIAFEPNPNDALLSDNLVFVNSRKGLYKTKADLDFYITKKEDGSSIFPSNTDFLKYFSAGDRLTVVGKKRIAVDSLDNQMKLINGAPFVTFLKLDTQGSELSILEGAVETLKKSVVGAEVEVNFAENYKGQAFFSDVDKFLRSQGFQIFDVERRYWKRKIGLVYGRSKGQLLYGDSIYLRSTESLRVLIDEYDDLMKKIIILHAVSVALLYGYLDYALHIFSNFKQLFDVKELTEFENSIRKEVLWYYKFSRLRGRMKLARFFYHLYEFLKPKSSVGADGDEFLGNTLE